MGSLPNPELRLHGSMYTAIFRKLLLGFGAAGNKGRSILFKGACLKGKGPRVISDDRDNGRHVFPVPNQSNDLLSNGILGSRRFAVCEFTP